MKHLKCYFNTHQVIPIGVTNKLNIVFRCKYCDWKSTDALYHRKGTAFVKYDVSDKS